MVIYHLVLFAHLLGLLIAAGAASVTHVAYFSMRRAATLSEAGRWGRTMKSAGRAFPFAAALLLGSGAYLVSDSWSWTLPWVVAALAGLAAIIVIGNTVMAPYGRKLGKTIGATIGRNGDGPVTAEVRDLLQSRFAISASFAPPLLLLAIVYTMTTKPGVLGSVGALLVAIALASAAGPCCAWSMSERPATM